MQISGRLIFRLVLVLAAGVVLWLRLMPRPAKQTAVPVIVAHPAGSPGVSDLSATQPLNQPGGGPAPAEAYAVYSALYREPAGEPLAIDAHSGTDIPQVNGSCLRPKTPEERTMVDAFVAANQQSHTWEQKFLIPQGYRMLDDRDAAQALSCLRTHETGGTCANYKDVRHVRVLGMPGFDATQTHALVSVIKKCGNYCGSGGIFEVERKDGTWQRVDAGDLVQDCSWAF